MKTQSLFLILLCCFFAGAHCMDEAELRAIRKPFDEIIARSKAQKAELDKKLVVINQKRERLGEDLNLFLAAFKSDKLSPDQKEMAGFGCVVILQDMTRLTEEITRLLRLHEQNSQDTTEAAAQIMTLATDAMIAANKKAMQEFDLTNLVLEKSKN